MKKYTEQEIIEKVEEIYNQIIPDVWLEKPDKINIGISEDKVTIELSAMYEAPSLNFKILKDLSDFFETTNINDDDRFGHRGCETCDYGSEYGFTLVIRPEK